MAVIFDALYNSPPAIPLINEVKSSVEVLLGSNSIVAMLSVKITLALVTPCFFESLDWIVFAQPISQVIPEIAKETDSVFKILATSFFEAFVFVLASLKEQEEIEIELIRIASKNNFGFIIVFYDRLIIQIYAINDLYLKIYFIFALHLKEDNE